MDPDIQASSSEFFLHITMRITHRALRDEST